MPNSVGQFTYNAKFTALEHQRHKVCGSIDIVMVSEHSWGVPSGTSVFYIDFIGVLRGKFSF